MFYSFLARSVRAFCLPKVQYFESGFVVFKIKMTRIIIMV